MDMEDISATIRRAQTGDSDAYGELVSLFQDMAYGYAYSVLNDYEMARDAAQEAFIEAYQCLPTLREALAFSAWLKRIVYKHCDRLIRGKKVLFSPLEDAVNVASLAPDPIDVAEKSELAQQLHDAIDNLSPEQRAVTTLFYINGYSYAEIGNFLEVPVKTIKSRLHTSRTKLKERLIGMVEDELKANSLPEDFAAETVEQAVARAAQFNREQRYKDAEQLLLKVISEVPQHSTALKELNHSLLQGRIYREDRWDLLPQLAEYGKQILRSIDEDSVHKNVAKSLLAAPLMAEAVSYLNEWISEKGPNLERLGMLAWAKGCMADYDAAEAVWQELLTISNTADADDVLLNVPFVTYTLVDCFAEAGELERAQQVAQRAWDLCRRLRKTNTAISKELAYRDFKADAGWMLIFHLAKLDVSEIGSILLSFYADSFDLADQAMALCIRNWTDDPEDVAKDWLEWTKALIRTQRWELLKSPFGYSMLTQGLRARGEWQITSELMESIQSMMMKSASEEAKPMFRSWKHLPFDPMTAILAKNWAAAEDLTRKLIDEVGLDHGGWYLTLIAAMRGLPTPSNVVECVEQKPEHKRCFLDWYVVAREAAAANDKSKAFDALRKALSAWTNPPYNHAKYWENDAYWGDLRYDPEFQRAFDGRRQRFGPIYGMLHYFPGW